MSLKLSSSKYTTATVLKQDFAKPILPYLPQKVVALKDSAEDTNLLEEFDSARVYLAKWAAGAVAAWNKRNVNAKYRSSPWERGRHAETAIGSFEILSVGLIVFIAIQRAIYSPCNRQGMKPSKVNVKPR
jgi:hypothetical protein